MKSLELLTIYRDRSSNWKFGVAFLAGLFFLSIIFISRTLALFESYDHVLNNIAFWLISRFGWLSTELTHDFIMAMGFLVLGLIVGLVPAILGVRKSWVIIGLLFTLLNLAWWYTVEKEVAESINSTLFKSMNLRVFRTYISDSIGAFIGGFLSQILVFKFIHIRRQGRLISFKV